MFRMLTGGFYCSTALHKDMEIPTVDECNITKQIFLVTYTFKRNHSPSLKRKIF